jgi:hypothetical protein
MKKKYSIYVTMEYHTCWEVEASSIEEAEQLHDWSHSEMQWKMVSDMSTTHIEETNND